MRGELKVGIVAPPWVEVPPQRYGGTELVIDELARGLQRAECDVRLFTTGDSTCDVPRRWLYPTARGTTASPCDEEPHIERAYAELAEMDVIHDHTMKGPLLASERGWHDRIVTTAHGPMLPHVASQYATAARAGVGVVCISHAQRVSAPHVPIAQVIHHGTDPSQIPVGRGDGGYVLFLGRMCAEKGAHRAITAARAAGRRIVVAAKLWEPAEMEYFEAEVEPLLGPDAEYVGEVGGAEKFALIGGAEALVNPIRWSEPFGLVMIEALACGTPVLAFAEGSAPEIVDHGRTGYLCSDEEDMARNLTLVGRLDRAACRARVESYFNVDRVIDDHLELYGRILEDEIELAQCG